MSQIHDPLAKRRLIERLSGWRLYSFLAIAFVNLVVLLALSFIPLTLSSQSSSRVIAIITAQVSLFAVIVGAFRFPIAVKISLVATVVLWSVWAVGQISVIGRVSLDVADVFFVFLVESLLLTFATTFFWWWRNDRAVPKFGMRDLLILLSAAAILFPVWQKVVVDWPGLARGANSIGSLRLLGLALANALWCVVVLCVYVQGILPLHRYPLVVDSRKVSSVMHLMSNRFVQLAMLIGLLAVLEFLVNSKFAVQRIVYLAWLVVSMVPVVGLDADTGRSDAVPPNMN